MRCVAWYLLPLIISRWLTQDHSSQSAGLNLYEYWGSNPLKKLDNFALDGDWDWGQYGSDVKGVFIGEGRALNPINWPRAFRVRVLICVIVVAV